MKSYVILYCAWFLCIPALIHSTWATDLTATTGNGAVYLNWTQSTAGDLEGYRVYYGPAPGLYNGTEAQQGASPIQVSLGMLPDPSQPAYVVTGLSTDMWWYFKVYALEGGIETAPSNEEQVKTYGWGQLSGNPLQNGGFEDDGAVWFPTGLWQPMELRPVTAYIDTNIRLAGNKSLKVVSGIQQGTGLYRLSASQDPPKAPNTEYLVRFWAKANDAQAGCFGLILDMDDTWTQRLYIQSGTYDWTQFARIYNTGSSNRFRIALLCEGAGTVWVDNIEVIPLSGGGVSPPFPESFDRYDQNPILDVGPPGSLDQAHVHSPVVLREVAGKGKRAADEEYKMYYAMNDGSTLRVGLATSPDGYSWTKHPGNPVLNIGSPGSWEETHVNPSSVLKVDSLLHLYYYGYKSPKWQLGHATSSDGLVWNRDPNNPVLAVGNEGSFISGHVLYCSVLYEEGIFKMWYTAYDPGGGKYHIFYATSPDGSAFTRQGLVLSAGSLGEMDNAGCVRPVVLGMPDETYTMWYSGFSPIGNTGCYATSPDGLNWTPVGGVLSPTFLGSSSFDSSHANPSAVLLIDDVLKMWYYGSDGSTYRIGVAEMDYVPAGESTATATVGTPAPTDTPGPTGTPTLTPTWMPTVTPTLTPTVTPTHLPPTVTPTHTPQLPTPTATPRPGVEVFQPGDGIINFNVYPDGSAVDGQNPNPYTPATYLKDQFASVGIRFRSTKNTYHGITLDDVGVGVIYSPDNMILGMVNSTGLDGNSVMEVQFDQPVQRAGLLRRGFVDYAGGNTAVTNFYDEFGALIVSIVTTEEPAFVSHQVAGGQPGIARIEATSSKPASGEGGIDDVMFSQVGELAVPDALRYGPPTTPTPTVTSTPQTGASPTPHPADINEDGRVDTEDLLLLNRSWHWEADEQ